MPYLGEIRLWAGSTPPSGWAFCDGTEYTVEGNEGLLGSIGRIYGRQQRFLLPDLRSRVPAHVGPSLLATGISISGGQESVSLLPGQVPAHSHTARCQSGATGTSTTAGGLLALGPSTYLSGNPANGALASASVEIVGTGAAHNNIQPYLSVNFIICVSGGLQMIPGSLVGGSFTHWGGMLMISACGDMEPNGFLRCDGQAISRGYYGLFAMACPTVGTFTVTIASPAVFTHTAHGLAIGNPVYFTTTGALPTGLTANTLYYVISAGFTSNDFEVSATPGGSAVNTSGSQSGTHTAVLCPFGLGDGSTTFNLPDCRNKTACGVGTGSGLSAYSLGQVAGEEFHTLTTAELPSHSHALYGVSEAGTLQQPSGNFLASAALYSSSASNADMKSDEIVLTGAASPHENRQPWLGLTFLLAVDNVYPAEFTGEIRLWLGPSAPSGWKECDGSALNTTTEAVLFAVIGYTFGGSGSNFNVPDFRGRVPIGTGTGDGLAAYTRGDAGGFETHVLSSSQMAAHSHGYGVADTLRGMGTNTSPSGNMLAECTSSETPYRPAGTQVQLRSDAISAAGGGSGHENRMPMMAFRFFIKK